MLKTLEEHKKLSFTHIMKHYKKGGTATPVTRNTTPVHPGEKQTLLLRYYPPADRKNFNVHKNIFKFAGCLSKFCPKVKGQLISKCFFGVVDFLQKRPQNFSKSPTYFCLIIDIADS